MRTFAESADNSTLHMRSSEKCYSNAHDMLFLLLLNGTVLLHTNLHNHQHLNREYILKRTGEIEQLEKDIADLPPAGRPKGLM